jgi:hypothetical protein
MGEPKIVLKSSNGKRDELLVYDDKVILQLWANVPYLIFSAVLFLSIYTLLFLFVFSNGGILLNGLLIMIGCFLAKGLVVRKYVFDINGGQIYSFSLDLIRRPMATFTQIGGIDKVWQFGFNDKRQFFFYKLWMKDKKYGRAIPLSGVHQYDDSFDKNFAEEVLPMLLKVINKEDINQNRLSSEQIDLLANNGNLFRGRFKYGDGKIYYATGIKRVIVLVLTYFLLAISGASLIYFTNGLFILVLIIALYVDMKIILKQEFYILPDNNLYLRKKRI